MSLNAVSYPMVLHVFTQAVSETSCKHDMHAAKHQVDQGKKKMKWSPHADCGFITKEDAHRAFKNSAPTVSSRVVDEVRHCCSFWAMHASTALADSQIPTAGMQKWSGMTLQWHWVRMVLPSQTDSLQHVRYTARIWTWFDCETLTLTQP